MNLENDIERVKNICAFIRQRVNMKPLIGIVCGSGASKLVDIIQLKIVIPFDEIPTFPVSTVAGHHGNLIFGELHDKQVVIMQGRIHLYEGKSAKEITLPIRVMKYLGIEFLFLTNASGSINPKFKCGDFCIVKDHINMPSLSGQSPLVGPNIEEYGPRFPSLTGAYDKELRSLAKQVAKKLNLENRVHEGVYFCQCGPAYETPAELRFFQIAGCDLIGMSTAHEIITAKHMGIRCFCLSLVSNECILDVDEIQAPNHEEVLQTGSDRSHDLNLFISTMVADFKPE